MGVAALVLPFLLFAQNCPTPTGENQGQEILVKRNGVLLNTGTATSLVSMSSTNPSFDFELSDPKTTVPNNDCKDETCTECGWYKAFWVFGDGNYKKHTNDVEHMDVDSRKASYSYKQPARYEPVVYLTERYHNDKKPDAARIQINVSGGSTTPADSPVLLNQLNKRAEIDYNHDLRKAFPTVFVLSHVNKKNVSRVLLFYNALYNSTNGATTPAELMSYEKTEVPAYFQSPLDETLQYELRKPTFYTRFSSSFFNRLGTKFGNCKEYSYDNVSISTALTNGLKEIRLFPVMNVTDFPPNQVPTLPARMVSVVLGRQPLSGDTLATLRSQVLALLPNDVSLGLDDNLLAFNNVTPDDQGNPEYIVGVADQRIPVVASHDPNNLFITKIDTLTGGRYRVSFSIRICNAGENPESNPILFFHDLTGGRYSTQPQLIDIPTNVVVSWRIQGGEHVVSLDGFDISGVPPNYQPKCRFVHFSIETDQVGVDRLKQEDPRALEVCVAFSGATGGQDCSKNDVLKEGDLTALLPPDGNADCWILFFLALIVLILIIYFWKQNQQPG